MVAVMFFDKKCSDNTPYEKIGNQKPVSIIDEVPFEIPDSWEWIRLSSITTMLGGYAFKSTAYTTTGIRVIRISDFSDEGLLYTDYKFYNESSELEKYLINSNDILMCMTGGTVGKTCLLGNLNEKMYLNQRVACIRNITQNVITEYLYMVLIAPYIKEIIASSKTSTNDNISMETISNFLFPLPPLKEQGRIVAKYQELLPLVEAYRSSYKANERLNASFPEQLKKSIIQLAVQGKLVPQDPKDEPASVLLERIRKEKEWLIKEGKIKRDKNESVIYRRDNSHYEKKGNNVRCIDNEIPFEIPDLWYWCRIKTVSTTVTKGTTPRGGNVLYLDNGIGFLRAENVAGLCSLDKTYLNFIDGETHNGYLKRSILQANDILITIAGTLGRTGLVGQEDLPLNTNQAVSIVRLVNSVSINPRYLIYALNSPEVQDKLTKQKKITAIPNLTLEIISDCLIPIPPLEEQQRIVTKIEELLPIIKKL